MRDIYFIKILDGLFNLRKENALIYNKIFLRLRKTFSFIDQDNKNILNSITYKKKFLN